MPDNNIADWQSLTKLYGEMCDEELLELDAQLGDLTEMAQRALRDEMKKRRLSRPTPPEKADRPADSLQAGNAPTPFESGNAEADKPHELTWKTVLCECNFLEEVYPIRMALWHAGVESWAASRSSRFSDNPRSRRILVAADQLDRAREILAQPIPQAIIEECKAATAEFDLPVCPKCGAEDPVLESAEPVNSWLCEECGAQWTDPVPAAE